MNWAQGRLVYIVLSTVRISSLFDVIQWAFAHDHSFISRLAKRGPNQTSVKFVWNNRSLKSQPLRLTHETHLRPFAILFYFVMLARTLDTLYIV